MQEQLGKAVARASGGKDDALSFMLKLAAGGFRSSAFDEEGLEETRSLIRAAVDMKINEDVVADGQVFHLPLMAKLLKIYADPDWEFVGGLGEGVFLGVDQQLPRTPAVPAFTA